MRLQGKMKICMTPKERKEYLKAEAEGAARRERGNY